MSQEKPKSKAKATIDDVAKKAGVGKATASRALNGQKGVSTKTRGRVLRAAAELDFSPDPVSQKLSARRTERDSVEAANLRGQLMYLYSEGHQPKLETPMDHAKALGYGLDALEVSRDDVERKFRELWARGIDGLLIRGGQGKFPVVDKDWQQRFPMVLIGGHPLYECAHVAFDFARGVRVAQQALVHARRRRLGFWLIDDGISSTHQRAIGAVLALQRARRPQDPEIFLITTRADQHTPAEVLDWMNTHQIDGIAGPSAMHLRHIEIHYPRLADEGALIALYGDDEPRFGSLGFTIDALEKLALQQLADQIRRERREEVWHTLTLLRPVYRPGKS